MKTIGCFNFFKRGGPKNTDPKSVLSSKSTFTDQTKSSGSTLNSDTKSVAGSSFPFLTTDDHLRVFTFSELKIATKNFDKTQKIGEGGFGCVYKGVVDGLEDPNTKLHVAVKQLGKRGFQGHKEWVAEVNVLGVVDHSNLVKLIGYCSDEDKSGIQRLLVYEYMPNRSVDDHLSSTYLTPLPWFVRLKIAQDSARGLTYLHEGMCFQIIFRDFKSSNILLDKQWNAKLSDFGLARLGPDEGMTHVSTMAAGTLGYAAPEYIKTGHVNYRIDVYAYGIFLYELITGRRPIDRKRPKNEQNLFEWVIPHLVDLNKFQEILDPRLEWDGLVKSAQKLAVVANKCLVNDAKARPKMSEVLEMVNKIVEASQQLKVSPVQEETKEDEATTEVN